MCCVNKAYCCKSHNSGLGRRTENNNMSNLCFWWPMETLSAGGKGPVTSHLPGECLIRTYIIISLWTKINLSLTQIRYRFIIVVNSVRMYSTFLNFCSVVVNCIMIEYCSKTVWKWNSNGSERTTTIKEYNEMRAFYRCECSPIPKYFQNSRDRLEEALTAIGWPMVQVGTSTIVALFPLVFKQSYLAMVFLKTVIVVVSLGMFHGLVVLPAILTAITASNTG